MHFQEEWSTKKPSIFSKSRQVNEQMDIFLMHTTFAYMVQLHSRVLTTFNCSTTKPLQLEEEEHPIVKSDRVCLSFSFFLSCVLTRVIVPVSAPFTGIPSPFISPFGLLDQRWDREGCFREWDHMVPDLTRKSNLLHSASRLHRNRDLKVFHRWMPSGVFFKWVSLTLFKSGLDQGWLGLRRLHRGRRPREPARMGRKLQSSCAT